MTYKIRTDGQMLSTNYSDYDKALTEALRQAAKSNIIHVELLSGKRVISQWVNGERG